MSAPTLGILLQEKLTDARIRNPRYSLRAFANSLGLSHSALSEILNGRRRVSVKLTERILNRLNLDPKTVSDVVGAIVPITKSTTKQIVVNRSYTELQMDQYFAVADWHHFAILSLAETVPAMQSSSWIAKRLGIKASDASVACKRLVRLNLLKSSKGKGFVSTGARYRSSDGVVNLALRRVHAQNLELARESLDRDSIETRDFAATTMAIDPKKLPETRKLIREFRSKVAEFLESGEKKEVYKLCIQLFPLTKSKGA